MHFFKSSEFDAPFQARQPRAAKTGLYFLLASLMMLTPSEVGAIVDQNELDASPSTGASNEMVRYSFCTDTRTDRSTGKIREVIFYSRIGTIRPGPDGSISFPKGFADFVDTQSALKRQPMSENCPLFESVSRAEEDLAIKRLIERPGIRDFVFLSTFVPR